VRHNKTSRFSVLMMLVALGILLWSLTVPCSAQAYWWQDLWQKDLGWQEETPPPDDPNQVINPEYLTKKQELEKAWNQLRRQNNMSRQYNRWTRKINGKTWSDYRARSKTIRLERELKKTPMYIAKGVPPTPEPETPAGEVLIKY